MSLPLKKLAVLLTVLTIFVSCQNEPQEPTFTVLSWNTYAFFDERTDGTEFEGFRKQDGYTGEKYQERVKAYALYLLERAADADLLVLEEIESPAVLQSLLDAGLKGLGFQWFGLASDQSGNLGVGFLSKRKPEEVTVHGIPGGRMMLSMTFLVRGEFLKVIGLHGRSRISDPEGSLRREEFALLNQLLEESEGIATVVCGDFNADPEKCRREIATVRGLYEPECPILVTGDGGECGGKILFSPFLDYGRKRTWPGTYFYGGEWSFLDNFLLNRALFDGRGWEYEDVKVLNGSDVTDYNGRPLRYDVSTGKGFSDHFAIMATFRYT